MSSKIPQSEYSNFARLLMPGETIEIKAGKIYINNSDAK